MIVIVIYTNNNKSDNKGNTTNNNWNNDFNNIYCKTKHMQ